MRWSPGVSLAGLGLILIQLAGACTAEVSTVVRVEMLFPEGEDPLDGVDSLRVAIDPVDGSEEIAREIARPSSGSWSDLDEGLELGQVEIESAVIVVEGLDGEGVVVSAGETIPVPVKTGSSGRVAVFVQRLGSSGLAPGLEKPSSRHAAAYLDGGGVLLAGGAEASAASEAWVYAVDVYGPIQVDTLPSSRSLAELISFGDVAMIVGGAGADSPPLVFDPIAIPPWGDDVSRPELASGAWLSPLVDALPGGGAVAVRDRSVLRFEDEPAGVARLEGELSRDVADATLTALTERLAALVGADGVLVFEIDGDAVDEVEIEAPPNGGRSGHAAAALSDGRLVLAGGEGDEPIVDVEVYDHGEARWTLHEGLLAGQARRGARLTRLRDDRLLLSGGEVEGGGLAADAVVIDVPDGGEASATPIAMAVPRRWHTATALPTGTVMLAGGEDEEGEPLSSVELIRPSGLDR